MSPSEAFADLQKLGTKKLKDLYDLQGGPNAFGVSPAGFKRLSKKIGTDHELAEALWKSGHIDAMMLAAMAADPALSDKKMLDRWVGDITFHKVADVFVDELVVRSAGRDDILEKWLTSPKEMVRRSGYRILAWLAANDDSIQNERWIAYLHRIMNELQMQENWARDGMNEALIAIGKTNRVVNMEAMIVAMQVGTVYVDYGDKSLKSPSAMTILAQKKLRDSLK